jgi:nucleotide-binding universal stress UspA family protein
MKKVLLTTDFSENARVAIDYGLQLFGADDVTYTLLNTYKEPGSSTAAMVSIADYLHKESKTLLDSTVKDLRQKYPNHTVEPLSLHGSLYPAINNLAKREDADIVVIGTRGATQVQNFFLGSNTMDVMRHSSIPAVIIPQAYSYEPIERIALAVDIKPIKHISILDPILDIAASKDASVHAFHIQENGNDEMSIDSQKVKRLFEACGSIAHTFDNIKSENVAAGIGSYVKDNGASMLALVARKHNFIERLFQKSITKEVSFLASFPMVIVRER